MSIKTFMNTNIWSTSMGFNTYIMLGNDNKVEVAKNKARYKALQIAGYIPGVSIIAGVARFAFAFTEVRMTLELAVKKFPYNYDKNSTKLYLSHCIRGVAEMAQLGLLLLIMDIAADKLRKKPENVEAKNYS